MGHYGYDQFRAVGQDHVLISNFRHPATRILSLYNYFRDAVSDTPVTRSAPEYFAVRLAKSASFETFVSNPDPRVVVYTSNHHYRQLAGSGWSLKPSRSLAEVCATIDEMAWFYVSEQPALSICWARRALNAPDFDLDTVNATPAGSEPAAALPKLGPRAFARLMALNRIDLAIYEHAVKRFWQEVRNLAHLPCADEAPKTTADRTIAATAA